MKSNTSFHNSGVCEQLQASIIQFFEENYAASCDVEIDAIICLSLLDTSDQNVIKIHKVLPKHLFKFSSEASVPQKSPSQDVLNRPYNTLKIPMLRPAARRRKPLKVNIARQIQKPFMKDRNIFNLNSASGKNYFNSSSNNPVVNGLDKKNDMVENRRYQENRNDNEQEYILEDLDFEDTKIKVEPSDSGYGLVKEKDSKCQNTDETKGHRSKENEILINLNSEGDDAESGQENIGQMKMYITNEGTVLKTETDADENMTVESLVTSQNKNIDSTNYSGNVGHSTMHVSSDCDDNMYDIQEPSFTQDHSDDSKKNIDYIVLQRDDSGQANIVQNKTNNSREGFQKNSMNDLNIYTSSGANFYGTGENIARSYTKSLLAPEIFKRKQSRPRKLNRDFSGRSSQVFTSLTAPDQVELENHVNPFSYENSSPYDGNSKAFNRSFVKVPKITPNKVKLENYPGGVCPTSEKKFFCEKCGTGFSSKKSKLRHERHTCGNRSFPCSICSKTFSRADSRQRHIWKVHGLKVISHSQVNSYRYSDEGITMPGENHSMLAEQFPQDFDQNMDQNDFSANSFVMSDTSFQEDNPVNSQDTEFNDSKCLVDFSHPEDNSGTQQPSNETNVTQIVSSNLDTPTIQEVSSNDTSIKPVSGDSNHGNDVDNDEATS